MANQFHAKIRFDPVEWIAYDEETDAVLGVRDRRRDASWAVSIGEVVIGSGVVKTPVGARATARRCLAKWVKEQQS